MQALTLRFYVLFFKAVQMPKFKGTAIILMLRYSTEYTEHQ